MSGLLLRHRDLLTASLMGYTAGYVTSNTKVRFDTFGGMMTGNTVKLGISLQQGNWDWVGVYSSLIRCAHAVEDSWRCTYPAGAGLHLTSCRLLARRSAARPCVRGHLCAGPVLAACSRSARCSRCG